MSYTLTDSFFNKGLGLLYPAGTAVRVRRLNRAKNGPDMTRAGIIAVISAPEKMGLATGRTLRPSGTVDPRTNPRWVEVDTAFGKGFVREDLLTQAVPVVQTQAGDGQALIQNMLRRDGRLRRELLYQAELIRRIETKGRIVPPELKQQHAALVKSFTARRQRLLTDSRLKLTADADPAFDRLAPPVVSGVGVVPLVVWACIAGVALVASVTWYIVYQSYQTEAGASEVDLKKGSALSESLEKLDPEEKTRFKAELQAVADKGFKEGYGKGKSESAGPLEGAGNIVKWGTIAFLATKALALI